MVPEVPSASHSIPQSQAVSQTDVDGNHLLAWLEAQRQADHEQVVEFARTLEQLRDAVRDQSAMLAHLMESERRQEEDNRAAADGINQLREHIRLVQRSLADHVEATTRIEQADATERERTPRQIADLSQQVLALGRASEAANGRLLALSEEVRHLRDERAPIVHAIDELQRAQLSLQSRVGIVDDLSRRFSAFQAVAEQSDEKLRNDQGRLDNQQKLLDVRVTRDLTELRRLAEEWFTRTEERMKPLLETIKQVSVLAEYRNVVEQRHAAVLHELEQIHVEIGRLDTQNKADRSGMKRWTDNLDLLERRLDETGANVWKLGERLATTATSVDGARTDVEMLVGRLDEAERKISRFEDERQRLESSLQAVESLIHIGQKDSRDQSGNLLQHVNAEVASLRAQIDDAQRTTLEHLRGLVGVLQQQLTELESDRA